MAVFTESDEAVDKNVSKRQAISMETRPMARQGVRQKSPNAPAYSIQDCLEDVRKLFRAEHQVPTSRESIAEHLSLAAQSGPFNRKLSSLRQFGLLEPIGKDLRVSDLFLRIEHAGDENERYHALREAMGRPTIFQGLLGQYETSGMPSDINLTHQLVIKYRFTKKNAETVSKAFLESYRFAGLGPQTRPSPTPALPFPAPPASPLAEPSAPAHVLPAVEAPVKEPPRLSQCRQEIPLGPARRAVLELPDDVAPEEIAKVIRVLRALIDTEA